MKTDQPAAPTPESRALAVVQAINDAGHYLVRHKHVPDAPSDIIAAAIREAESAARADERERIAQRLDRLAAIGKSTFCEVPPGDALSYDAAMRHFPLGISILPQFAGMAALVRAIAAEETRRG